MRLFSISALAVAVFASLGIIIASPAQAATSSLDYTVSSSDPTTNSWPSYLDDCSEFFNWRNGSRHAVEQTASVEVSGDYQFQDRLSPGDGYIAILAGPYDPNDVSNCIVAIDSAGSATLDQGTIYTVLLAGKDGTLGDFSYSVDGPGEFSAPAKSASLTELDAIPGPVAFGNPVDLAARITSPLLGVDLSGTVEFFADGTSLGTSSVAFGTAVLTGVQLPEGTHLVTAVYSGNAVTFGSRTVTPVTVTVSPAAGTPTPTAPTPPVTVDTSTA